MPLSVAVPLATPESRAQLEPGAGRWQTLVVATPGDRSSGERSIAVFVPPVADPATLPVVYFLHGLPGSSADLCNQAASTDLMRSFRTGVEPFILACPDGNPSSAQDSEWADSVDGQTRLETFLTTTAIAAVEGTHRRSRGMRAIAGFSMGGFGAAAIALRHPELYSQVASFAGYFHLDDPDRVFGTTKASQDAHDPTSLVSESAGIRWYLEEPAGDNLPLTAHDSERYAPLLRAVGATVQLVTTPGTHSASWALSQLPSAALFLSSGWLI